MRLIITLILLFFATIIFAQKADDIVGKYRLPNKLDVEIFKHKDKYYGRIIALNGFEDGQTIDVKNSDKTKQKEKLVGKIIIKGLVFDEDEKQWLDGEIYGAEKGILLDLKVTAMHEKEIVVVGSKYLFWRTLVWEKI